MSFTILAILAVMVSSVLVLFLRRNRRLRAKVLPLMPISALVLLTVILTACATGK